LLVLVLLGVNQEEGIYKWLRIKLFFHIQALSMHVAHSVEDEAGDAKALLEILGLNKVWN